MREQIRRLPQQKFRKVSFNMYPYMKELVTEQLRRMDLDLMLFHEHGTPDRQYPQHCRIPGRARSR